MASCGIAKATFTWLPHEGAAGRVLDQDAREHLLVALDSGLGAMRARRRHVIHTSCGR